MPPRLTPEQLRALSRDHRDPERDDDYTLDDRRDWEDDEAEKKRDDNLREETDRDARA